MTVRQAHEDSHYSVLGLERYQDGAPLTPQQVKASYKKALLIFHPDKFKSSESKNSGTAQYSVDDIALAYKILSDPHLRGQYDNALRQTRFDGKSPQEVFHHTGLDTVDLDDLNFDEEQNVWTKDCRCGSQVGFLVTEPELLENVDDGELIVGCRGCSLWLRVLFSMEE
ncbi:DnaJ domain protein [Polychaeton citri CBS 116435]|uniref:Diphthamide biosynthesis protein 4 n=1 Tax=Polychaeton citri CBS 116435 TaxID=1314669 RepID=A0A9P4QHG8_9PEZI|nr:DnaJ domain protein [Polychaeton citri CBS 116435]